MHNARNKPVKKRRLQGFQGIIESEEWGDRMPKKGETGESWLVKIIIPTQVDVVLQT